MADVFVRAFHPLTVELPDVDPIPAGELRIVLPAVRVTWGTVDLLDWTVRGELDGYAVTVQLPEPLAGCRRDMID